MLALKPGPERGRRSLRVEVAHLVLEKGPSLVKVTVLTELLKDYPEQAVASYLLEGFHLGFYFLQGVRLFVTSDNLRSVRGKEHADRAKLGKELREGRILGKFAQPSMPNLRVFPLGIVPKKTPGECILIHCLSHPLGQLINDGILEQLCSVQYTSFDKAVHVVRAKGPGTELAKCDIKSAVRLLPVHPRDFELLGFCFEGSFYRTVHYLWAAQFHVQRLRHLVPFWNGSCVEQQYWML